MLLKKDPKDPIAETKLLKLIEYETELNANEIEIDVESHQIIIIFDNQIYSLYKYYENEENDIRLEPVKRFDLKQQFQELYPKHKCLSSNISRMSYKKDSKCKFDYFDFKLLLNFVFDI